MSEAEWAVRCDLAALYRLAALQQYDDILLTHISARVPGPQRHFLINPFGLRFCEVTASSLVKVDIDGKVVATTAHRFNYAGFVIHSAIHAAREDAHFIIHFHTDDGVAVASQQEGILPLNQRALGVLKRLAYHDYEGVATSLEERQRIVADLGDKTLMLLRNHGTLALVDHSRSCVDGNLQSRKNLCDPDQGAERRSGERATVPAEIQKHAAARIGDLAARGEHGTRMAGVAASGAQGVAGIRRLAAHCDVLAVPLSRAHLDRHGGRRDRRIPRRETHPIGRGRLAHRPWTASARNREERPDPHECCRAQCSACQSRGVREPTRPARLCRRHAESERARRLA